MYIYICAYTAIIPEQEAITCTNEVAEGVSEHTV